MLSHLGKNLYKCTNFTCKHCSNEMRVNDDSRHHGSRLRAPLKPFMHHSIVCYRGFPWNPSYIAVLYGIEGSIRILLKSFKHHSIICYRGFPWNPSYIAVLYGIEGSIRTLLKSLIHHSIIYCRWFPWNPSCIIALYAIEGSIRALLEIPHTSQHYMVSRVP